LAARRGKFLIVFITPAAATFAGACQRQRQQQDKRHEEMRKKFAQFREIHKFLLRDSDFVRKKNKQHS